MSLYGKFKTKMNNFFGDISISKGKNSVLLLNIEGYLSYICNYYNT